jgi:hypothetical protein
VAGSSDDEKNSAVTTTELQFSQYDFDAKSLIVKQTDQNDNETTSSIDISEDGAADLKVERANTISTPKASSLKCTIHC